MEPKGSLFLRSNHMVYSKGTRVSNWHQVREAEPKDYDIHDTTEQRNLHKSTYRHIGNVTSGELPSSTSHAHMDQIKLKSDFQEQTTRHPMVNLSTFSKVNLERDINSPAQTKSNNILPRHPADHNKRYLETTYCKDYKQPFPDTKKEPVDNETKESNNSMAYRKFHSQFTDTADYRRPGLNTWQDESGMYGNTEAKRSAFPTTNTIPERLL